jgi:hypothetical protein
VTEDGALKSGEEEMDKELARQLVGVGLGGGYEKENVRNGLGQ